MSASAAHPVDSAGLVLPEPSWPDEPGSAGALEPLRRFCNTTNRENGADAWRTTRELADWLAGEGYRTVGRLDAAARARLITLRDALWRSVRTGDFAAVVAVAGPLTVRLATAPGGVAVVPAGSGVDAVVDRLLLTVAEATAAGTLERLKSCDHCRWVFHDTSKNCRGRWCSMAACGGRAKARAYRRRRAAAPTRTEPA